MKLKGVTVHINECLFLNVVCLTQERDLVIFPTDMDALNEKIREQLGHIFNAGSDKAQHIMRMHFQLYAVELQPLPPSKCKFGKSVFSKELAVILGHPNGDYLTRTANLKMKKKKGKSQTDIAFLNMYRGSLILLKFQLNCDVGNTRIDIKQL